MTARQYFSPTQARGSTWWHKQVRGRRRRTLLSWTSKKCAGPDTSDACSAQAKEQSARGRSARSNVVQLSSKDLGPRGRLRSRGWRSGRRQIPKVGDCSLRRKAALSTRTTGCRPTRERGPARRRPLLPHGAALLPPIPRVPCSVVVDESGGDGLRCCSCAKSTSPGCPASTEPAPASDRRAPGRA
jgi:hypothetical protein